MARGMSTIAQSGSTPTASVVGLEAGRAAARVQARRRKRGNAARNLVTALVAVAILGGAAYVGWGVYQDQQQKDAELREQNDGRLTPREAIDVLEDQPAWNGPGNAVFGVGGDDQP